MSDEQRDANTMRHYHVYADESEDEDEYWVGARSETEARRLVSLNVPAAAKATEAAEYRCELNAEKAPPRGMIYRRLFGPVSVDRV